MTKKQGWVLIIAFVMGVICAKAMGDTDTAPIVPHPEEAWKMLNDEEQLFIAELDRLRAKMGLPQIIVVDKIVEDSRRWSAYLHRTNRFYHGNPTLENIAMGHETGERTFLQWMASSGHKAKLMNRNDMYCGIGQSGKYWTYRAASSMDVYYTGKDPDAMVVPEQAQYKVVYKYVRGNFGIVRKVAEKIPVE